MSVPSQIRFLLDLNPITREFWNQWVGVACCRNPDRLELRHRCRYPKRESHLFLDRMRKSFNGQLRLLQRDMRAL